MKKAVAAQVSLVAMALASAALADGPPAGGSVRLSFDNHSGRATSFTGGVLVTAGAPSGGASGQPTFNPARLTVTTAAPQAFFDWVDTQLSGASAGAHKLQIASLDASGNSAGYIALKNPFVSEVDFPAVASGEKSAASLMVAVGAARENVVTTPAVSVPAPLDSGVAWNKMNFTASVSGISTAPSAVGAIGIAIPQNPGSGLAAGKVAISRFHLTFDASAKSALQAWTAPKEIDIRYLQAVAERSDKTTLPLFELKLGSCTPTSQAQSTTVDVTVNCGSVAASGHAGATR